MISIVMAYYMRNRQLIKTLDSFTKSNYKDFNVIIVDDCSSEDIVLPEYPFEIIIKKLTEKTWNNSSIVFNIGFNIALKHNPDIVVIHNPECYHVGDVLSYASKVTDKNYISFGCYGINEATTFSDHDIHEVIAKDDHVAKIVGWDWKIINGWYNHPNIDPMGYHYCSAITAENLCKINGFDERFIDSFSYEDEYMVRQVETLGLRVEITTEPFVVHQWHTSLRNDNRALWDNGANLYNELIKKKQYRAKHVINEDLKLNK
jgi:glycosyltransferase involved in cell wall biosynthesis